ncbi:hypothetical protein ACOM2C_11270 [Pseudarthrobacter sp. So.54]
MRDPDRGPDEDAGGGADTGVTPETGTDTGALAVGGGLALVALAAEPTWSAAAPPVQRPKHRPFGSLL